MGQLERQVVRALPDCDGRLRSIWRVSRVVPVVGKDHIWVCEGWRCGLGEMGSRAGRLGRPIWGGRHCAELCMKSTPQQDNLLICVGCSQSPSPTREVAGQLMAMCLRPVYVWNPAGLSTGEVTSHTGLCNKPRSSVWVVETCEQMLVTTKCLPQRAGAAQDCV